MQRIAVFFLFACLVPLSGCSVYDWAFAAFGGNYSGGGPTSADRKYHFDRELEKWKEHQNQTNSDGTMHYREDSW